jgi:rhodanese-related sulfurtransferase
MLQKMRHFLALMIIFSMILGACTTAAPAVEVQPTVAAPTQAPAQPTAVPPTEAPEPTAEPAPDLMAIFSEVIAGLPPEKSYGLVGAAKLNEELADKAPFLLDVREAGELEKDGYIQGTVHIPVRQALKNLDKLPGLDDPIVIYCGSGHRGAILQVFLKALGYTNVRNLGGGMGAWKKAGFDVVTGSMPAEAAKISTPIVENQALFTIFDDFLSSMPDNFYAIRVDAFNESLASGATPVIIDTRSQEEWDKDGYIKDAILIPLPEFMASLDKLPADKDAAIMIYCGSGHRGAIAMTVMRLMGYTNVINLNGGLGAWKTAQFPVEGWVDWAATWKTYLTNMPTTYYLVGAAKLNEELAENPPFMLDVRENSEVEARGYIEGTVHIAVREVLKNLDKLPAQDQPIVVICSSGHRGAMVMAALQLLGWQNVRNLGGGLNAWIRAELPLVQGIPEAPVAGTAPEVNATMLRDLDNFLANMPEGFYTVSPADLNTELAGSPAPMLIDVRSAEEIANGHIEGSEFVIIQELLNDMSLLPAKDGAVVLICQSGHRGALGLIALRMMGWTNVRNLVGGVNAWVAAELPLVQ